ncbi:hypothetical protein FCOIX_2514 [Fusarium coicis]|nr:hypothetical protein FCOIX_2514 [Fusarium coicis]
MRYTTISLIFLILLFTFHGAIDVRSSAKSLTMSSTTLAPDLQVPSGQDVLATDGPLAIQAPFTFISSPGTQTMTFLSLANNWSKKNTDPKLYSF